MRYPVGFRPTWQAALEAAMEAARMTGLRYRVEYMQMITVGKRLEGGWEFAPVDVPNRETHMGVRV